MLASCGQHEKHIDNKWLPKSSQSTVILLQPLSSVPHQLLAMLKDSIPRYYPVSINIAAPVDLPVNAWYAPRGRYKADTLLTFLLKRKSNYRLIAGITTVDISTTKDDNPDWGVMGFGYQPGQACVISTFRLKKDNPAEHVLFMRLMKTLLHEMGHNFGLAHCPNKQCIMADAEGKLNQDNETGLCAVCRRKLNLH